MISSGGLSHPSFNSASRLADLGSGELRQQDLAESVRWDKSRLSHQLTRMEGRGLTTRRPADGKGVIVGMTAKGNASQRHAGRLVSGATCEFGPHASSHSVPSIGSPGSDNSGVRSVMTKMLGIGSKQSAS